MKLCTIKDIQDLKNTKRVRNKDRNVWGFTERDLFHYHLFLDGVIEYLEKRNEKQKDKL